MNIFQSRDTRAICILTSCIFLSVVHTVCAQHQLMARWDEKGLKKDGLEYDFKPDTSYLIVGTVAKKGTIKNPARGLGGQPEDLPKMLFLPAVSTAHVARVPAANCRFRVVEGGRWMGATVDIREPNILSSRRDGRWLYCSLTNKQALDEVIVAVQFYQDGEPVGFASVEGVGNQNENDKLHTKTLPIGKHSIYVTISSYPNEDSTYSLHVFSCGREVKWVDATPQQQQEQKPKRNPNDW